jgi:hypothetical protein
VAIRVPKDRLLAFVAIVLTGASIPVCRAIPVTPSLEVALNLLWLGLVLGSFTAWICRRRPVLRLRRLELLALVFVFALLFPVISPSDDLAQPLENDGCTTQLVVGVLKAEKQVAATACLPFSVMPKSPFLPALQSRTEIVTLPSAKSLPSATGHATGNHSPPHP